MSSSEPSSSEVITTITPSAPRRAFATFVLYSLGGIMAYLAVSQAPTLAQSFVLLVMGAGCAYLGWRMWQATSHLIELTQEEIRLSDGTLICRIEDLHKVDRGFFAFKPSNGFLLSLKTRHSGVWAPGLYWRFGKRVGVGGVTSGAQTKVMADAMAAMIVSRDGLV